MDFDFGSGPVWLFLTIFGVFNTSWIVLYIMAIRRGFKDQTFGIPFVALAINMAWDIIGVTLAKGPLVQSITDAVFYSLQLVILYQVVKFGAKDFPQMRPRMFIVWVALSQALAIIFMGLVMAEIRDPVGVKTGFIDTFINSALFIGMFYRRPNLEGQTIYIGLLKWISTAIMCAGLYVYPWPGTEDSVLLPVLYLGIFVLDTAYVVMVYERARSLGINVWKRW